MICGDIIGERSRLSPDRTAVVDVASGRRLTYLEMNSRAAACARTWLYGLGLKPGDRIGILSGNRLEFLDAFFAAGKSGVILVPLGTRLTAAELAVIASDCGLSALVFGDDHAETVKELAGRVDVGRLVALDEGAGIDAASWNELQTRVGKGDHVPSVCAPDDPYCLLYTSGTTGRPKGVITPHRMVAWNAYNTVACWQLTENDVSPIFTPLYHAGGLGAFLTPILLAGGTVILHREFDASEVWRVIEDERCTVVLGVPTIWKMLAEAPEFESADLSHVRWFISGGAPLPRHLVQIFRDRGVVMRQGYGLTEVGVNCFSMTDEEAWAKAGSIGKPLMFTEARVMDPDGKEMPPDEVGELCFRGPHVSAGYWNNPQATAESRDKDGWFHTGDMACRDSDGFYSIAGPRQGHVHLRWGQRLPGRDRKRPSPAPAGLRRGGCRGAARRVGRDWRRLRRAGVRRGCRDAGSAGRVPRRPARALQDPEGVPRARGVTPHGLRQSGEGGARGVVGETES